MDFATSKEISSASNIEATEFNDEEMASRISGLISKINASEKNSFDKST